MDHHQPVPSLQLQLYQALSGRMTFSGSENQVYQNEWKGFIGEKMFAKLLDRDLTIPHLALHSLYYIDNGNHFQPDCMLLLPNRLHLYEIKNYEGEFIYQEDYLQALASGKNYRDPVDQVKRGKLLLQNMLPKLNIPLQITIHVVFINPSFTLFQARKDPNIILPTQLKSYFQRLNSNRENLPGHYAVYRQRLLEQHTPDPPFKTIPSYHYEKLYKGVLCRDCRRPMQLHGYQFCCGRCSFSEYIDSGVLRMVIEFHLLFPSQKIKKGIIHHWCGEMLARSTLTKILQHYLKSKGEGRGRYYEFHPTMN